MSVGVSIIIVSWNTRALLATCLDSLFEHPPHGTFEVWVVDNASDDGSAQFVRDQFPQIRLIPNTHNLGYVHANNQAIEQCSGEYILLLNPDTVVPDGALSVLCEVLGAHQDIGAVGPRLLNPDGSAQQSWGVFPSLVREVTGANLYNRVARFGKTSGLIHERKVGAYLVQEVDWIRGACLMTKRSALNTIGLLDESFHMYSEEMDLCYRLKQAGYQSYYVPLTTVIHVGGAASEQVASKTFLLYYRSVLYFFVKHHRAQSVLVMRLIVALKSSVNLLRGARSPLARDHPQFNVSQVRETYWELLRICFSRERIARVSD